MKKVLIVAAVIVAVVTGRAQAQSKMEPGNVNIFFRAGAPFAQMSKFNEAPFDDFTAKSPALGLGYELGMFTDGLALGLEINYATFKSNTTITDPTGTVAHRYGDASVVNFEFFAKYYTPLKFGPIGTYVRADILPFAIYKKNRTTDYNTGAQTFSNKSGVKMTYGAYAGGTFQLTKSLNAFAEIGYGYTAFNAGISLGFGN
ncbi:MAG: hypothetical protein V4560_10360 [Bacteroidota bacterium]